jgi:hypothetical protein
MIVTICSSANFYKQAVEVEHELQQLGFEVIIPATARKMKASGDYDVEKVKTWYGNRDDYHKKTALMQGHFEEVAKGDICLVLNYEKHGQPNYIGGNVLMEMTLAFWLKKPIFILNEIPEASPFLEEIIGLGSIPLHGKLEGITQNLEKTSG